MIWALLGATVLIGGFGWLRLSWLVVTVTGPSMRPTLQPGDRLLVRRTSAGRLRAGQIVVLADGFGLIVKRVAAIPGDLVPPGLPIHQPDRVPPGRLVLLGDNHSESSDSRTHGYYDATRLVGLAVPARFEEDGMTYLAIAGRVLIGLVLAIALVGKLRGATQFAEFVGSIRQMGVLPDSLARPVAIAVVATEAAIVLALAVPTTESGVVGFGLAAGLLAAFTAGLALSLARGNRKPCRCFGRSETPLSARHIARNTALVTVALLGIGASLASGTPTDAGISAVAVASGAIVAALIVSLDDLLALV